MNYHNIVFEKVKLFIKQRFKKNSKKIFTTIYRKNLWGGKESISGPGSDFSQVNEIIKELPNIIKEYEIKSFLDIPCGDFNWMKFVNMKSVNYIGGDIVPEIINSNNKLYKKENQTFRIIDIINDNLPKVDLIFCRDCFVHFPLNLISNALEKIKNSKSTYLMTTIFTDTENNKDIALGEWRPLNLIYAPFNFPKPIKIINEKCTENNNTYTDKSLALWRIQDLILKVAK